MGTTPTPLSPVGCLKLERPQCNCPVLGPFLYGDAP
jgi:hypothetical protein